MKGIKHHNRLILFLITAFILLSFITSFAGTTTYHYDDANREI